MTPVTIAANKAGLYALTVSNMTPGGHGLVVQAGVSGTADQIFLCADQSANSRLSINGNGNVVIRGNDRILTCYDSASNLRFSVRGDGAVEMVGILYAAGLYSTGATSTGAIYEAGRSVPMGHWVDMPFNAANFLGLAPLTWTVAAPDIYTNKYMLIGKTLFWSLFVANNSTVGGSAGPVLLLKPPVPCVVAHQPHAVANVFNNLTGVRAEVLVHDAQYLALQTGNSANWQTGTLGVHVSLFWEMA